MVIKLTFISPSNKDQLSSVADAASSWWGITWIGRIKEWFKNTQDNWRRKHLWRPLSGNHCKLILYSALWSSGSLNIKLSLHLCNNTQHYRQPASHAASLFNTCGVTALRALQPKRAPWTSPSPTSFSRGDESQRWGLRPGCFPRLTPASVLQLMTNECFPRSMSAINIRFPSLWDASNELPPRWHFLPPTTCPQHHDGQIRGLLLPIPWKTH